MNTSHYSNNDRQQPDKQGKKTGYSLVLLVGLIVFHVVHNILWIFLNNTPPSYDAAFHTVISLRFFDYIRTHFFSFNLYEFLTISNYYPPFIHWFGALLGIFSPFDARVVQLSGTIFLSLSLVFSYRLKVFHQSPPHSCLFCVRCGWFFDQMGGADFRACSLSFYALYSFFEKRS